MILVDSNVILDIATADQRWLRWSEQQLAHWANRTTLAINPIIYAEVSVNYATIEELDGLLALFEREPLPYVAGFLAGKAFRAYRQRAGQRRSPMPDIYVGAHAACRGYRLLTRDPRRYRTYFPTLELIAPDDWTDPTKGRVPSPRPRGEGKPTSRFALSRGALKG